MTSTPTQQPDELYETSTIDSRSTGAGRKPSGFRRHLLTFLNSSSFVQFRDPVSLLAQESIASFGTSYYTAETSLESDGSQFRQSIQSKILRSQPQRIQRDPCRITIRRNFIFEDSYAEIMRRTPSQLKGQLMITFEGEDGLGHGNGLKHFFSRLSQEIFNPSHGLFESSFGDENTLQINSKSDVTPDHLRYFRFVGRYLGLAIFHQQFTGAYFVNSFYKILLGKKVDLLDLARVDFKQYESMIWVRTNTAGDSVKRTFSITEERLGGRIIEFKRGGAAIEVTEEDKEEYIDAFVDYHLHKRVKEQYDALISGIFAFVPRRMIYTLTEGELELIMGGIPNIDVNDWSNNTDYNGYHAFDPVIKWFWECMRNWPVENRSRVLRFTTGKCRPPSGGFRDLRCPYGRRRFTIEFLDASSEPPRADKFSNTIYLPSYEDYPTLERMLSIVLKTC